MPTPNLLDAVRTAEKALTGIFETAQKDGGQVDTLECAMVCVEGLAQQWDLTPAKTGRASKAASDE